MSKFIDYEKLERAINSLTRRFLGKHGIVAICDERRDGSPVILVCVVGSVHDASLELPRFKEGFEVIIEPCKGITPQ